MLNKEGAELLKKVIIKKYGKVESEKITANENDTETDTDSNTKNIININRLKPLY